MFTPDCAIAFILQRVMGSDGIDTPCSYEEAESSLDRKQWLKTMHAEIKKREEKVVMELVKPPKNCNTIRNKWVSMRRKDIYVNVT